MKDDRWGRKETNVQALHSSGCLKGKARPLSIAAILMQESELLSLHSASYSEERERGSETSPPPTDWMINDRWPVIDHCPKAWLIGQRDDNLCSLISTRQTMTDDRESDSALAAVTSKVTGTLGCSRPAMSKLLFVCMGPCVSCCKYTGVCVCSSFVMCASYQLYCSSKPKAGWELVI